MNCFNPNRDSGHGQKVVTDWMGVRVGCICGCSGPSVGYEEACRELESKGKDKYHVSEAEIQSTRESLAWVRWRDLVALVNPEEAA